MVVDPRMPITVSRITISRMPPAMLAATRMRLPSGVNFAALPSRLISACLRLRWASSKAGSATGPHAGRHPRRPGLVLQIADIIDTDDGVACIADWFIASGVRLAQDVGLSEVAFALRNRRNGFSLWVENGANCPRSVVLLNVRRHTDEVVAALNKERGRPTLFLLDLVNQHKVIIHLGLAKI